jgi:SHS2 domain-containing protein
VDWLGELAYLAEANGFVADHILFRILSRTRVEAELCGRRHGFERVIKAVTYHDLSVEETCEGYMATVVFDV